MILQQLLISLMMTNLFEKFNYYCGKKVYWCNLLIINRWKIDVRHTIASNLKGIPNDAWRESVIILNLILKWFKHINQLYIWEFIQIYEIHLIKFYVNIISMWNLFIHSNSLFISFSFLSYYLLFLVFFIAEHGDIVFDVWL